MANTKRSAKNAKNSGTTAGGQEKSTAAGKGSGPGGAMSMWSKGDRLKITQARDILSKALDRQSPQA